MKVWQPGTHLIEHNARSRSRTGRGHRRSGASRRSTGSRGPTRRAPRLRSSRCSRRPPRRSRPPILVGTRRQRRHRTATSTPSTGSSSPSSPPASLGIACSYAQTYFTGWTGERMLADLRNHLFRHLQRLSLGFYERNRAGVLISRLTNDVEALDQLVTDGVTSLSRTRSTLGGSAVILFFLNWQLALATLTVMPGADRRDGDLPEEVGPLATATCARRSARSPPRSPRTSRGCACCRHSPASAAAKENFRRVGETYRRREPGDRRPERRSTSRSSTCSRRSRPRSCSATAAISYSTTRPRSASLVAFLGYADELLRPGAAALAALQHLPLGGRRARQDHGRPRRGAEVDRRRRRNRARRDRAATSASTTSTSPTRPAPRCCTGSTSTSPPGRPSRSSATPAPASRRSRS